jgi:uncharacterized membrane protein (DUF2068 family)
MAEDTIARKFKLSTGKPKHNRWLILIAAFKLAQALLFVAAGLVSRHMIGKDLSEIILRFAHHLHFGPESRFIDFVLDRVSFVNDRLLRRFSIALFAYAALGITEGTGLYLEKAWGEYTTLIITASFLPWEVIEIFRRITPVRAGLLAINIAVLIYLIKVVLERGKPGTRSAL